MSDRILLAFLGLLCWNCNNSRLCGAQELLFEDSFETALSDKWEFVGLDREDVRIRDGALEIRLETLADPRSQRVLKVNLPFSTADSVVASVEVTVIGESLPHGAFAGLCLTNANGTEFTVRKTNIDGYFVLSPGEVEFIGEEGQEGEPGKYTVKYWPADPSFGPLRVIVRGDYAHFQVGPNQDGSYKNLFHSAINPSAEGMGFGLTVVGSKDVDMSGERWVRFDNFQVTKL